jgi:chitin synthase
MATTAPPSEVSDLTSLIGSTNISSAVYPSDDAILSILQARFRSDLNYTRLGSTTLVAVNPLRTQANLNDASAESYIKQCYSNVDWEEKLAAHPEAALPPHPYELGLRVYHRMRRTKASQAIVYR